MGDRPTPQSIGVCALIALRSDPSSPLHEIEFNPHEHDRMTLFLEDSIFHNQRVSSLGTWIHKLSSSIGTEAADLLLETLRMASDSVDALVDLMDSLRSAFVESLVDSVSVHGVYLRQTCLGFEELSFESVTFLWQEFCNQLGDVADFNQKGIAKPTYTTGNVATNRGLGQEAWPKSQAQVERLLQQTCQQLDQTHHSFEQVELQVRALLDEAPETAAAYFLRFLNCLHHKDRSAFDALHQYFDHVMIQKQKPTKEVLQFSAILLALVYDSFGNKSLARMATQEAVRVAQQSKDPICVAFALGKLFQFEENGNCGRRELLKRCAVRATQGQIRQLVVGASLCLSLDYLQDQQRDPTMIWRQHMEANSEPTADRIPSWDRPTCLLASPEETMDTFQRQTLVEAGIWDELGVPVHAALASLVALTCHAKSVGEGATLAMTNLARLNEYGNPSNLLPRASAKLASRNFDELSRKEYLLHLFPNSLMQLHKQSLHENRFETATFIEIMLQSSLPPGPNLRNQFTLDLGIATCCRLCRSHNWLLARALALKLLQSPQVNTSHRSRLHLVLAAMELESTTTRYVAALPRLLEAISMREKSSTHNLHANALLTLARIFLRMRNSRRALSVTNAVIAVLHSRGHLSCQAEAYLIQAKCFMQLASRGTESTNLSPSSKKKYNAAFRALKASQSLFKKCQDKGLLSEVYYLQARIAYLLGRTAECEGASREFMASLKSKRSTIGVLWEHLFDPDNRQPVAKQYQ